MEGWAKPGGLFERKGGVGLEAVSGGLSFKEFCCKCSREMRQSLKGKVDQISFFFFKMGEASLYGH